MKLNIFKIPKDRVKDLKDKFKSPSLGLKIINSQKIENYQSEFYFSEDVKKIEIPWVETYSEFFIENKPANTVYFACYLWESSEYCFALSYGKCHFYLRQFCDHDFGTYIAKRIANKVDIRQKSSKKFAGKKKKEIKSYTKNSKLDIESGESDNLNQKYFRLHSPIVIPARGDVPETTYTYLYIRRPDQYRAQVGDVDFVIDDEKYIELKKSLQSGSQINGATIFDRPDLDMVELSDPDIDALAYVSTRAMTEKVRIKQ
jgi:hypothetical protein